MSLMMNIFNAAMLKRAVALIVVLIMVAALIGLTGCGPAKKKSVKGPVIEGAEAYHVIVAAGEPEGVAAALAAARNGMKTLLVEKGDALGGLMTLGMLNILDMNVSKNYGLLTRGIFEEFYNALGDAFDIEEAKAWFMQKCDDEPNLTVMLNTEIVAPVMDGNTITGLEIKRQGSETTDVARSLAVIDATVDGDIAAAAGVPFTVGGEDYGANWSKQGVTLVFEVSGVNWAEVTSYIKNDGNPNSGVEETRAWGYGERAESYVPADGNMRLRGPNIARQKSGNLLLNALIIFDVDALDPQSYNEGIERGRKELPHVVQFMRENFSGFENAVYVGHAPRLYVRETRHFIGEYRLTITDVLENRDQWDKIGHGKYPVDIQPTYAENRGVIIGAPDIYSIPFRSLVPLGIEQLLIAGRSASYDSIPHGSARVMPIGMVAGEACGTAVAYSVGHSVTFRQMAYDADAISWLQNQLRSQGAYLIEYVPPHHAVMEHWAYPGLAVLRELGMVSGGYNNDYQLDEQAPSILTLQYRATRIMRVANARTADRGNYQIPAWEVYLDSDDVTVGLLLLTAARCVSFADREWVGANMPVPGGTPEPMSFADAIEAEEYLISRGVLGINDLHHFQDLDAISTNGQLAYVLGALFTTLMES